MVVVARGGDEAGYDVLFSVTLGVEEGFSSGISIKR